MRPPDVTRHIAFRPATCQRDGECRLAAGDLVDLVEHSGKLIVQRFQKVLAPATIPARTVADARVTHREAVLADSALALRDAGGRAPPVPTYCMVWCRIKNVWAGTVSPLLARPALSGCRVPSDSRIAAGRRFPGRGGALGCQRSRHSPERLPRAPRVARDAETRFSSPTDIAPASIKATT